MNSSAQSVERSQESVIAVPARKVEVELQVRAGKQPGLRTVINRAHCLIAVGTTIDAGLMLRETYLARQGHPYHESSMFAARL